MKKAGEIALELNQRTPFGQLAPHRTVADAVALMDQLNAAAILIMEESRVVGIFSERDYARKILLHGKSSQHTPLSDVMSTRVYYVGPDYSGEQCLAIMSSLKIRHLPVLDAGQVLGLISMDELAGQLIRNRELMISELLKYITGSYVDQWNQNSVSTESPLEPLTISM